MGKALVQPLGQANTHALRQHLRGRGSLEKGMTKTHTFLAGPEGTRGKAIRDFRAAIDAGTSTALVKPLSKANTRAVITARSPRRPSSMRENSEQPLQRDPNVLSASKANALLRLSPNAPMSGAGVRSTEASAQLAGWAAAILFFELDELP